MKNNLEKFNELWAVFKMRPLTQEEYDKELEEHPNLWNSYYLQQEVAKKYHE